MIVVPVISHFSRHLTPQLRRYRKICARRFNNFDCLVHDDQTTKPGGKCENRMR
jgi:hypothetical protein